MLKADSVYDLTLEALCKLNTAKRQCDRGREVGEDLDIERDHLGAATIHLNNVLESLKRRHDGIDSDEPRGELCQTTG